MNHTKNKESIMEQKKIREEWLEANRKSLSFKMALQCLEEADFSHPSDAVAQAAVTVGDMDAVRKLADAGYKRWCVQEVGENAFKTPCEDVVRFIVENGYDVNTVYRLFKKTASPLCAAAEHGHANVVRYLLSVGADAKFRNNHGFTPLHFAASSYSLETVKLLVEAGADINALTSPNRRQEFDREPMSVLFLMARNGFYEGLKYLVEQGAKLHYAKEPASLLHTVCESGIRTGKIRETTKYLLEAGLDPLCFDSSGISAVGRAAFMNNLEALQTLAEHGTALDKPNVCEYVALLPLEIAARNGYSSEEHLIKTLDFISEHSLPFSQTHVLNCAVYCDCKPRAQVCRYLLEKGCPANSAWVWKIEGREGLYSPLHAIIDSGNNKRRTEIVSMLLEAGADVHQKDPDGFTPLARAVQHPWGDVAEVIELLHNAGADFNVKTKRGNSILKIAQRREADDSVLELLKKYGAK